MSREQREPPPHDHESLLRLAFRLLIIVIAGWVFPSDAMEVSGPAFIILPTEPLTCLAVSPAHVQKGDYAVPMANPFDSGTLNDNE